MYMCNWSIHIYCKIVYRVNRVAVHGTHFLLHIATAAAAAALLPQQQTTTVRSLEVGIVQLVVCGVFLFWWGFAHTHTHTLKVESCIKELLAIQTPSVLSLVSCKLSISTGSHSPHHRTILPFSKWRYTHSKKGLFSSRALLLDITSAKYSEMNLNKKKHFYKVNLWWKKFKVFEVFNCGANWSTFFFSFSFW